MPRILRTRKYVDKYPCSASFKYIATILIESFEIKGPYLVVIFNVEYSNH